MNGIERRIAKLEQERGGPGDYLTVIIRHFGEVERDPSPVWNPAGRVLVVHEGFEHLGWEMMRSIEETRA